MMEEPGGDESWTDAADVAFRHARLRVEGSGTTEDELGETLVSSGMPEGGEAEQLRLERGDVVGRYVILEEVGAGAMGVVYAAYDPELDRKLALKLMRGSTSRDVEELSGGSNAQDPGISRTRPENIRMLREAQALARLSHPNVVAVHDVGDFEGRIFVAMAFIDGRTLGDWIREERPTIARVLEVFQEAGRGLSAAHHADLVHRDFKPDNVILGADGTVTVLDFGLAREASRTEGTSRNSEALDTTTSRPSLSIEVTRAGGILGTPAYMAPEQHVGLPATARSDQFSFCVALYEALYGERPHAGDTVGTLVINVAEGRMREPPEGSRVPRRIRQVLLQGLSGDPDLRYPDMDALLGALAEASGEGRSRRRWAPWIAVPTLALGLLFGASALLDGEGELCASSAARAETIWDTARSETTRAAFLASGQPYARHAWERVDAGFTSLTAEWRRAHREACEATKVRGEQSQEMMDRKMLCLDVRRRSYLALADRLEQADAKTVEHAVVAMEALPGVESCADARTLLNERAPIDEVQRASILAAEELLARASALGSTGDSEAARQEAARALESARTLSHPPLLIDALSVVGGLESDRDELQAAVDLHVEALKVADESGDDWRRAREAMRLIPIQGTAMQRPRQADMWAHVARGAIRRLGNPADLDVRLAVHEARILAELGRPKDAFPRALAALGRSESEFGKESAQYETALAVTGIIAREAGKLSEAERFHREVLEGRRQRLGAEHPQVAAALGSLANVLHTQGRHRDSVELNRQALEIIEGAYGSESAAYVRKLNNYAAGLSAIGELEEAERMHLRAIAHVEKAYGPDEIQLAPRLENLGTVYSDSARWDEALATLERALAIKTAKLGGAHPSTALSMMNKAVALHNLGRNDEAEALLDRALEIWIEAFGENHADIGIVLTNLGAVKSGQGEHRVAAEHHARALALFEQAWGLDSPDLGYPLTGLGIARLGLGEAEASRSAFGRAETLRRDEFIPAHERVRMDFGYARALAGHDRVRAVETAQRALSLAREEELDSAPEIEAWLVRAQSSAP
jgi:tetratricopeptide (TPR) repeat protein